MSLCLLCKTNCYKSCKICNEEFSCISRFLHETKCKICKETCVDMNYHQKKCDLCQNEGCGKGSFQIWYSWKTDTLHTLCMDCIFEGAMYVKALNHFNQPQITK